MDSADFVKEVETKYDVKSIKVKGVQIWPFLRIAYFFTYGSNYVFNNEKKTKLSSWKKIKRVKNIFYGFFSLFKKYTYFVFLCIGERKLLDGKYIYKRNKNLINILSVNNTLVCEEPLTKGHFKKDKIPEKNIISTDLFLFLSKFIFIRKINIRNEYILKIIENDYHLHINYKKITISFLKYTKIFNIFFKIYKPKTIFLNCYYCGFHPALIYAAHKYKIKVVEMQHGIINKKHPAYNVFTDLGNLCFPDYLFAFGDYIKNIFNEFNYFIKIDNVLPIGSMYIDYINKEYTASKKIIQMFKCFRKKYKKIIVVSNQWTIESKLINFLKKSAALDKNILYIFMPRDINKDYSNVNFPNNIIILKDLNIYQVAKEADFHSTVYSTCALEAPALGTPNILINIDNLAKNHYIDILFNRDVTIFVDTEKEFVNTILNWHKKTKKEIMDLHKDFYTQNHKESLEKSLQMIQR